MSSDFTSGRWTPANTPVVQSQSEGQEPVATELPASQSITAPDASESCATIRSP